MNFPERPKNFGLNQNQFFTGRTYAMHAFCEKLNLKIENMPTRKKKNSINVAQRVRKKDVATTMCRLNYISMHVVPI